MDQITEHRHRFGISQCAGHTLNLIALSATLLKTISHSLQSLWPRSRYKAIALADQRHGQALVLKTIASVARFVVNPLFVHVVICARQHTHYLQLAGVHTDVAANSVQHIHRLDFLQFPWAGLERIRTRRQRTDGAKVDHVSRHF